MFDLKFYSILSAYNIYYNDINNYSRLKNLMNHIDNREAIVNDLFSKYKIYDIRIINNIITYYHTCKNYF